MKNITAFAVLVIMLHCAQPAFSQEEQAASYAVSISTELGIFYGRAEEIVYPSSGYKAPLLSQLLWDIKPVVYYGLGLDFSRAQPMTRWGFFTNLSLKNGIPGNSGNMEDRDWLSPQHAALTNYSIHDNITNQLFFFDVSAGFSFPLKHIVLLKTYLTVSYMYFDFSGQNGAGLYDPETNPNNGGVKIFDGKVINYTQEWFIIAPGVSLGYHFNSHFYAELVFQISPLVFCNDLDDHLRRDIQFRDYMRGGLFLEPGFHFSWFAGKRIELSLEFAWWYIRGTWGETYIKYPGSTTYNREGTAGARLSMIDTGLCLKIHL
ncbi:MAG: omptin family outer membrane protease [Treponema sp.]|jgi:outer membrane protease|nr:omptin family outer membrane protease [Treponema sp.]